GPVVDFGAGTAPVPDGGGVGGAVRGPVALGVTLLGQPVRPGRYVRVENVTAQLDEVRLHLALVQDEEHVRAPQRLDRLQGQLVGVARPDADDMNLSHTPSLPHPTDSPAPSPRQRPPGPTSDTAYAARPPRNRGAH